MSERPIVTAILITFQRTAYALRTVGSVLKNLSGCELKWYVSDDGSPDAHHEAVLNSIVSQGGDLIGAHNLAVTYGAGANLGLAEASKISPLTLWLEDDWVLEAPLDVTRYLRTLIDCPEYAMIRLGYLNLGMYGKTVSCSDTLYWFLNRGVGQYVYTGHPSLRHSRFHAVYGPMPEGLNPGETELKMSGRFSENKGPGILYPVENGVWGPFVHIGTERVAP